MKNTGQIYAFDMDMKRINLLKSLTQKAGCTSELKVSWKTGFEGMFMNRLSLDIDAEQGDFLKVDPKDPKYAEVSSERYQARAAT